MGDNFIINERSVTREQFVQFQAELEKELELKDSDVFKDQEITFAEIEQLVDFDKNGLPEGKDFDRIPESKRISLFSDLKQILEQYDFKLGERLRDCGEVLELIRQGHINNVPSIWWMDRKFVLAAKGSPGCLGSGKGKWLGFAVCR